MADKAHLKILKRGVEAWNQWCLKQRDALLREANLRGADLRHANLHRADLYKADFSNADLSNADLSNADLREAHLCHTNLSGANLRNASLSEADLSYTNLSGANLRDASLSEADLRNATFGNATLSGAYLDRTTVSNANLSGANLSDARFCEADFRGANLRGADLSHANLREANLSEADLRQANLSGAYLGRANLREANLRFADLSRANLSRAQLNGANLSDANLREADLREADLRFANFSGADLLSTNLTDAQIGRTVFGNINLSDVKGLETIKHRGPSTIGIDTITESQGKIPELFLKRAGVLDVFITYMPSPAPEVISFYSCFISYCSKDEAFAKRLYADLQTQGVRCWYAPENLKWGAEIREGIDHAIRLHEKLLLVLSAHSLTSRWVQKEVETAFEQEAQQSKLVLFPIRLDNTVLEANQAWAADIRRMRNIGDFTNWKDYDAYQKAFERLLYDLHAK